jgi:S1-C subfamily serine protease
MRLKIVFRPVDTRKASASLLALLFATGLLVGGLTVFYINYRQISGLNNEVAVLESQIAHLNISQNQSITNQTITIYQNGAAALAELYSKVSESVVLVQATSSDGEVQGSGFVYNFSSRMVVITNFHVIHNTTSVSVTFASGNGYLATVLGSDVYSDLAVLSVDAAPSNLLKPLQIVSSSSLRVGDQVIAIGNPYGLVGSLTTGIVSALGRSIQEDYTSFSIANIIQTSTPINPGNSGGPLLNAVGDVIGITTAIVSNSQGLGFAVPSSTILKELPSLVNTGTYSAHSYLGIASSPEMSDMNFALAQELQVNVTYGRYVGVVTQGGPSEGKLQPADIIIALNETTIRNSDDLASYLEGKTLPGDVVVVMVVRNNATVNLPVTLGTRPPPPT